MPTHPPSHLLAQLVSSNLFQQLAPLIVFLLVPALVLTASAHRASLRRPFDMVLDVLSAVLPWNWAGGSSSEKERERRKLKKKGVRTRAEQVGLGKDGAGSSKDVHCDDGGHYPGIVNISGTYCFMDSTLQAMASLTYLQPHVEEIHARAEALDVPTPVVDALRDVLIELNTPRSSPRPLRPHALIEALAAHSKGKHNALFSSREHQDAQELFQLVSEAVKSEALAVYKEGLKDRGLGALAPARLAASSSNGSSSSGHSNKSKNSIAVQNGNLYREENEGERERERDSNGRERDALVRGVFDGLTANRRSCMQCGYTEAVMHFAFDNWQLAVPRQAMCRLEECLADYTRLEVLTDCVCRKCSMMATAAKLEADADRLAVPEAMSPTSPSTPSSSSNPYSELVSSSSPSSSKRRRAREARKLAVKVKQALEEGRIEEDIKGVKMERVISGASTKQAMIARPPPVLALHLNRSLHWGHYATKNNCHIQFPEILDLTPFTTSGQLSTSPSSPISAPPPPLAPIRSSTPTPSTYSHPRTLYRLAAVVCHYGQHSFGHYVCFRRKPRPPSTKSKRWDPPALRCPLGCACAECERSGPVREEDTSKEGARWGSGRGWLRVSDESVSECGIEAVLAEGQGAFMLYYERVVPVWMHEERELARANGAGAVYAVGANEARGSEETLRPRKGKGGLANGSYVDLPNGSALVDGRSLSNGSGSGSGGSSLSLGSTHTASSGSGSGSEAHIATADAHTSSPDARAGSPGASGKRTFDARIVRNVSTRARPRATRADSSSSGEVQGKVNGHRLTNGTGAGSSHTKVVMPTPTSPPRVPNGDVHARRADPQPTSTIDGTLVNGHGASPERRGSVSSSRSKSKSKSKSKSRARSRSRSPTRRQEADSARGPPLPNVAPSIPQPVS
ncbi:hypothetical protein EIP86_006417 [Pleurotus ostreatoroseus]|nr:hypothetical protein EIP86_006417 [Pleurotus ostreatoroseus]